MSNKLLFTWNIKNTQELEDFTLKYNINNTQLCSHNNNFYKLLTYNKYFIKNDHDNINRFYKSVIVDKNGKILSVFLPKSIEYKNLSKVVNIIPNDFYLEEFVPGININLFYDDNIQKWNLHSRYNISCKIKIKKCNISLTIRELFYDICKKIKFDFNKLDKKYTYSFIIQDPYISNYYEFTEIKLYLINIFEIKTTGNKQVIENIDTINIRNETKIKLPCDKLHFPNIIIDNIKNNIDKLNELIYDLNHDLTKTDSYGYILKSYSFPSFSKFINPYYKQKYEIYDINKKMIYFYLTLRYTGKTYYYLKLFPEKRNLFSKIRYNIHELTYRLLDHYRNIYIRFQYNIDDINNPKYKYYIKQIHKNYLSYLLPNNKYVDKYYMQNYINSLNPLEQYYLLVE